MTSDATKTPTRRFLSFSLRELCLLMLTVGALAGWWRSKPYFGNPTYSTISRASFDRATQAAAAKYFADQNRSTRLLYIHNNGTWDSISPQCKTILSEHRYIIDRATPRSPQNKNRSDQVLPEPPSPLHIAIVNRLQAELELIPAVTVKREQSDLSSDISRVSFAYDFQGIKGVLLVQIMEAPIDSENNAATREETPFESSVVEGNSRLSVKITLVEMCKS